MNNKFIQTAIQYSIFLLITGNTQSVFAESISGWHTSKLQSAGALRYFRYFVPEKFKPGAPLVILLHGGSRSMHKLFRRHAGGSKEWPLLAEKNGFLLVTPNGTHRRTGGTNGNRQFWNDCRKNIKGTRTDINQNDVEFISQLIDWAKRSQKIDSRRVYITGASNGGMMSYRIAMEIPDKITAVAVFIANLPHDSECKPVGKAVPMMIVNGTADPFIPYNGGEVVRHGGYVRSTQETLHYWLKINKTGTHAVRVVKLPDINKTDDSYVVKYIYGKNQVVFYKIVNGGHQRPSIHHRTPGLLIRRILGNQNRDIEGAREAWKFFLLHRK